MGNIVTILSSNKNICYMHKWCANADILQKRFGTSTTILTNNKNIPSLCPNAKIMKIDDDFNNILSEYANYLRYFSWERNLPHKILLHKTYLLNPNKFYEPIVYLDTDVDISIGRRAVSQINNTHIMQLFTRFVRSNCTIQATPDHSAPVNTGIMLIKPSRELYDTAYTILKNKSFNYSHGFEFAGTPKQVIRNPKNIVMKARGYWADTWKFVTGGSDQGLFTYLSTKTQYCQPFDWNVRVRHFWATDKPWISRSCKQFFNSKNIRDGDKCSDYIKLLSTSVKKNCRGRDWPIL